MIKQRILRTVYYAGGRATFEQLMGIPEFAGNRWMTHDESKLVYAGGISRKAMDAIRAMASAGAILVPAVPRTAYQEDLRVPDRFQKTGFRWCPVAIDLAAWIFDAFENQLEENRRHHDLGIEEGFQYALRYAEQRPMAFQDLVGGLAPATPDDLEPGERVRALPRLDDLAAKLSPQPHRE